MQFLFLLTPYGQTGRFVGRPRRAPPSEFRIGSSAQLQKREWSRSCVPAATFIPPRRFSTNPRDALGRNDSERLPFRLAAEPPARATANNGISRLRSGASPASRPESF